MLNNQNKRWNIFIGILIVFVAVLHYSTPIHLHYLHELYRVFFYIPIILASFRYQLKGGVSAAVIIIVIYLPHVAFQWGGDFLYNFSRFIQMIMYLIIATVAGVLAKRETNERRKYQQAAFKLERSYERLKVQSEKLAEIEEQLRHADRLSILGELSASLAHEVRNPLGSIYGVVEILRDKFKKERKDYEFMEILVKEVKRLNEVVENYLALGRKPRVSLRPCNLQEIVQSVIDFFQRKANKHNIALNTDFPDQSLIVTADENQLRQILINLILNSINAISDKGSITIKAELVSNESHADEAKQIYLSVIDTGNGMKQHIVNEIFKPFFTTRADGTGLGLSIVKRIVDQNKWKIQVGSKPYHGTTITIIFPFEVR